MRIVLVDDHQVLREGLRVLLEGEADLTVVGEAANAADALTVLEETHPDLIIIDLGLPDVSGLKLIEEIRARNAQVDLIVLSMHTKPEFVSRAMELGVNGYVPKSSAHTSLFDAIRVVRNGDSYLHPKAATALVASMTGASTDQQLTQLSEREIGVVRLVAMGFTNREIGEKLLISPKTVDTYRQRAMDKLGLERRADMVRFAVQAGLLEEYNDDTT
jgi:DNA-binding NarL/FixJ family response regulator